MSDLFNFNSVWLRGLDNLLRFGERISPRGIDTLELPQATFTIDMIRPVLTVPERSLNYRFMAAEALWILNGDDRVETIAPYNSKISQFSDDGKTFFGAYGPEFVKQLPYVVRKLVEDPSSRQAGMTFWRQCPPATKDVPCTVSLFFQIRKQRLNAHVFMRSSDIWLGMPYDVFNFSMIGHMVCAFVNKHTAGMIQDKLRNEDIVIPGLLYLTAASSHLYGRDVESARVCVKTTRPLFGEQSSTPPGMHLEPDFLEATLRRIRDQPAKEGHRWWEAR
jgi:thymidylate synthase